MVEATNAEDHVIGRFHTLVEHGSVEELQRALQSGAPVNAPGHIGRTALMVAIEAGDLEKVKLLVEHGADPEQTDDFNYTALRTAVYSDFVAAARYLLSLGVDRGYHPKYPLKQIDYSSYRLPHVPLPPELEGLMSETEWSASQERGREAMRELGEHPTIEPMITDVPSVAMLQLFLDSGEPLQLAPKEVQRTYLGLPNEAALEVAPTDYAAQKFPRFGTRNPEPMNLAFWRDMIRTGVSAFAARRHFNDESGCVAPGAVWCYDRFGSSLTPLPDGRFVQIGGEHEDFYDPDFHIYNDVVVHDGQGGFQIYGYPEEVFPPTDFHTATLVGDAIYIIGCLGYLAQRFEGVTPIYRLKLNSWEIDSIETKGGPPGWLHKHRADYDPLANSIRITGGLLHIIDPAGHADLIANNHTFELDLSALRWRQIPQPSETGTRSS